MKYIPILVERSNAGGQLWSVGYVDNHRFVEKGEIPSHSYELIEKRCTQLNLAPSNILTDFFREWNKV